MQNAVMRAVQGLKSLYFDPYILVNYDQNHRVIEVYDNGTGMNKEMCLNNFLSIGDNSFWQTKNCYNDYGNVKEGLSLISSHGIGVLSYFLIANEVELFSCYKDSLPVHMTISGYDQNVVFMKMRKENLPKFNQEICKLQTPWEQAHGTCIRLKLKEGYDVKGR